MYGEGNMNIPGRWIVKLVFDYSELVQLEFVAITIEVHGDCKPLYNWWDTLF